MEIRNKMYFNPESACILVLVSVVAMAMAGLSIMPHQEARFLTPMLVPLVMIYTWNRAKFNRMFMVEKNDQLDRERKKKMKIKN